MADVGVHPVSPPATAIASPDTKARHEHTVLSRVLRVRLEGAISQLANQENFITLPGLSNELKEEGPVAVNGKTLERAIVERISSLFPEAKETPFAYLLGVYQRADEEERNADRLKDKVYMEELKKTLRHARELSVSYSGLMLMTELAMFPQPPAAEARGPLQLMDHMLQKGGACPLPNGFLPQLVERFQDEGLEDILGAVFVHLPKEVQSLSLLGDFQGPTNVLSVLSADPRIAAHMVAHENWCPEVGHGRAVELSSILGPFFHVSALPDLWAFPADPDVIQQCFSNPKQRHPRDMESSFLAIRNSNAILTGSLHKVLYTLLKNTSCKEKVLEFLAMAVNENEVRGKMHYQTLRAASHGFMYNLGAVMLKLCEPFLDYGLSKIDKLDPSYVITNERVRFNETKLAASSEEVAAWVDKRNASRMEGFKSYLEQQQREELEKAGGASSSTGSSQLAEQTKKAEVKTHFICECFFITAKTLHLGLIRIISKFKEEVQQWSRSQHELERMETSRRAVGSFPPMMENQYNNLKRQVERDSERRLLFDATLQNPDVLVSAVQFYRMMCVWLMKLGNPTNSCPVPPPPPEVWSCMPEYFADDMAELLVFVGNLRSHGLCREVDMVSMDCFMDFVIVFSGSTLYIKNPYLRANLVDILMVWIVPEKQNRRGMIPSGMQGLFEEHQMAVQFLVPNLLKLYVDIEFTGSHSQFYDKFNIRHKIAELLEYLWGIDRHRQTWKKLAHDEQEGLYLKFVNMVVNDLIHLLDEALKKLPELRELQDRLGNATEVSTMTEQQRQEAEQTLRRTEDACRSDLMLANDYIELLQYTSVEIKKVFLLPEMVGRIVGMLNYFLVELAGPNRNRLKVRDTEKYAFKPVELLEKIVQIYNNIAVEGGKEFAAAIAKDHRSYSHDVFLKTLEILRSKGSSVQQVEDFRQLAELANKCAQEEKEEEEALGDVPDEFLCAIEYEIMKEPVTLPKSGRLLTCRLRPSHWRKQVLVLC
eukprot:scaffold2033_cov367-Prasinococcus_capsulatus_cf.AAC.14